MAQFLTGRVHVVQYSAQPLPVFGILSAYLPLRAAVSLFPIFRIVAQVSSAIVASIRVIVLPFDLEIPLLPCAQGDARRPGGLSAPEFPLDYTMSEILSGCPSRSQSRWRYVLPIAGVKA